MKIKIAMGHFLIEFENGYTLSVANGFGTYTENHSNIEKYSKIIENRDITASWVSEEVEIAIMNKKGEIITGEIILDCDKVKTVSIKELISVINILNFMKYKGD